MDMFYNNPIRTLLVLVCMLIGAFSVSAQTLRHQVSVTSVTYNGTCTEIQGFTNPDFGVQILRSGTIIAANSLRGENPAITFVNGTAKTVTQSAALNLAANFQFGMPFPLFNSCGGNITVRTYEDNSPAAAATPHFPDNVFDVAVDGAPHEATVALPTAAGTVTRTITGNCFDYTLSIVTTASVPSTATVPTVTGCAGTPLCFVSPALKAYLDARESLTDLDFAPGAAIPTFDLVSVRDHQNLVVATGTNLVGGLLTNNISSVVCTASTPTQPGTYTYTIQLRSNTTNCTLDIPVTVVVPAAISLVGNASSYMPCPLATPVGTGSPFSFQVAVPTGSAAPTVTTGEVADATGLARTLTATNVNGQDIYTVTGNIVAFADVTVDPAVLNPVPTAPTATSVNINVTDVCLRTVTRIFRQNSGAPLSCNRYINLSLGTGCSAALTPALVLNGVDAVAAATDLAGYTITLLDLAGNVVVVNGANQENLPFVTVPGMGAYKYEITNPCGDKCWGEIAAKDKVGPACTNTTATVGLLCTQDVTTIEPVPSPATSLTAPHTPYVTFKDPTRGNEPITAETAASAGTRRNVAKTFGVGKIHEGAYTFTTTNRTAVNIVYRQDGADRTLLTVTDGCGIAQIGYTDNVQEGCFANGVVKSVVRTWYAIDNNGNKTTFSCTTTFNFRKATPITIADIAIPGEADYLNTYATAPTDASPRNVVITLPSNTTSGAITTGVTGNSGMILCSDPLSVRQPRALGDNFVVGTTNYLVTTGLPRIWDATSNGGTGAWINIPTDFSGACMITANYTDTFIPGCTAEVGKISRAWTVTDMCTKMSKTATQIITIMAPRPVVTLNDEVKFCDNTTTAGGNAADANGNVIQRLVSTDAGVCASTATILNATVTASANACATTVTDAFITITGRNRNLSCDAEDAMRGVSFPMQLRGLDAKIPNLPAGVYTVRAYFVNNCGMRSDNDSNTAGEQDHFFTLIIQDNEAPTAISVDRLSISLTNAANGETRIYATQLDKASQDNCGLQKNGNGEVTGLEVAIVGADGKPGTFGKYVTINCSINPMVALRVTDCATKLDANDINGNGNRCEFVANGNTNVVMVPLDIQDKSAPVCNAPGNMTMPCADWLELKKVAGSGAVTNGSNPAVIERLRAMAGSFSGSAAASCQGATSETYTISVNACSEGTVVRSFKNVKGTQEATCTQTITFTSNKPQSFSVVFPKDETTESCGNEPTSRPVVNNMNGCENVQVTYSDEVFVNKNSNPLTGAKTCKKIVRTWKVINMCLYNPTRNNSLPQADFDCAYDEAAVITVTNADNSTSIYFKDDANTSGAAVRVTGKTTSGKSVTGNYVLSTGGGSIACTTPAASGTIAGNRRNDLYLRTYVSQATAAELAAERAAQSAFTPGTIDGRVVDAGVSGTCDDIIVSYPLFDPNCNFVNRTRSELFNDNMFARFGTRQWIQNNAGSVELMDRSGDGVVRYVQVINIEDNINPTFTTACPKPEITTTVTPKSITDCKGTIELINSAGDNCAGDVTVDLTVVSADNDFTAADGSAVKSIYVGKGEKGTYTGTVNVPLNKVLTVIWSATDICGNVATCSYKINVPDTKAPIVVCRDLSTELMALGANSMLDLGADKFVLMATDNCTDMATMMASASFDAAGTQKTRRFTCADIKANGVVDVQIYVKDAAGNTNFCRTNAFFRPEDRTACGFNGSTASVAGLIQNETSEGVEKVTVKMNADAGVTAIETGADGKFNYNLPLNKDYSVNPAKTTGLLNGVSTYDLVLIQKHILDVEKLNSSYKVVAADVNKDGKVTTLDIVELRKAILRISTTFPNGQNSWRFVSKNYAFSSTEGAAGETFPETYNINNLKAQQKADFVGVKVGDVNESAAPNSLIGAEERGARKAFVMTAEDRIVKAGEEVAMNVVADAANVAGFQYTMNFDKNALEFAGVKAGAINVTDANVAVVEGALTTSWNGEATNGNLFTVVFRAKTDGRLSELVNVNSRYTEAEAYTKQAETMNVELRFNGTAANGFALFQNQPNPFTKETIIGFNLPSAQAATLKVYDVTGKAVKVVNADYAKGYNEVKIADLKATGVLYYTLETQGFTATKKMVIVE